MKGLGLSTCGMAVKYSKWSGEGVVSSPVGPEESPDGSFKEGVKKF